MTGERNSVDLGREMLRPAQRVLGFDWEATPENEGYEGDAGAHQQDEVFY